MRLNHSAGRKGWLTVALVAFGVMFSAVLMFGYNPFLDNLGTLTSPIPVIARWDSMPVTWFLNPLTPSNNVVTPTTSTCSTAAACVQQALANGFSTWTSAQVAGQSLTSLTTQYAGSSSLTTPDAKDCQNVIGFSDTSSSDFSTGTIAFTQVATVTRTAGTTGSFQYKCSDGTLKTCNYDDCIGDADIEFNPSVNFTTASTLPANTFSVQSVATHEEGHLLGLDHGGIAHAVMFPFGDSTAAGQQVQLATDDAVGISFLYPAGNFSTATGVISGKVTLSGAGVFAAHVVAVDASTGDAVVDGLTAPDGSYSLVGVPPGTYQILALPLAPNSDTGVLTLDNFSGWDCGYADSGCTTVPQNPTSYTGRYH